MRSSHRVFKRAKEKALISHWLLPAGFRVRLFVIYSENRLIMHRHTMPHTHTLLLLLSRPHLLAMCVSLMNSSTVLLLLLNPHPNSRATYRRGNFHRLI